MAKLKSALVGFLAVLSLAGLLVSLVVHVATYFGVDIFEVSGYFWLLHVGVFVVVVPAWGIDKNRRKSRGRPSDPPAGRAGGLFGGLAIFFFLYAFVNFGVTGYLLRSGGSARLQDGSFAIENHGDFVRAISEAEYHRYQAYEARLFSGHWMLFYSISTAMLLSMRQSKDVATTA